MGIPLESVKGDLSSPSDKIVTCTTWRFDPSTNLVNVVLAAIMYLH